MKTVEERQKILKEFAEHLNKMRAELENFRVTAYDFIDENYLDAVETAQDKLDALSVYADYYVEDND